MLPGAQTHIPALKCSREAGRQNTRYSCGQPRGAGTALMPGLPRSGCGARGLWGRPRWRATAEKCPRCRGRGYPGNPGRFHCREKSKGSGDLAKHSAHSGYRVDVYWYLHSIWDDAYMGVPWWELAEVPFSIQPCILMLVYSSPERPAVGPCCGSWYSPVMEVGHRTVVGRTSRLNLGCQRCRGCQSLSWAFPTVWRHPVLPQLLIFQTYRGWRKNTMNIYTLYRQICDH